MVPVRSRPSHFCPLALIIRRSRNSSFRYLSSPFLIFRSSILNVDKETSLWKFWKFFKTIRSSSNPRIQSSLKVVKKINKSSIIEITLSSRAQSRNTGSGRFYYFTIETPINRRGQYLVGTRFDRSILSAPFPMVSRFASEPWHSSMLDGEINIGRDHERRMDDGRERTSGVYIVRGVGRQDNDPRCRELVSPWRPYIR